MPGLPRTEQSIGRIQILHLDLAKPLYDLSVEPPIRSVLCFLSYGGLRIGTMELPAVDGGVSAYVLRDAAAARFAWSILGEFFRKSLYNSLRKISSRSGFDIYREDVPLGHVGRHASKEAFHDEVGWTVFLQELWARPTWPGNRFYETGAADLSDSLEQRPPERTTEAALFEVADDIQTDEAHSAGRSLAVCVGGVPIGVVDVPRGEAPVTEHSVLAAVTEASGFELCVVAVREGLLGAPVGGATLRERLAVAAARRDDANILATPILGGRRVFLARRSPEVQSASPARRAVLPAVVGAELAAAASSLGEDLLDARVQRVSELSACYAPELVLTTSLRPDVPREARSSIAPDEGGRAYDRRYFESLFAQAEDPWNYTTTYERAKYEQALSLLEPSRFGRALEIGCAEGHFTRLLAPRVRHPPRCRHIRDRARACGRYVSRSDERRVPEARCLPR